MGDNMSKENDSNSQRKIQFSTKEEKIPKGMDPHLFKLLQEFDQEADGDQWVEVVTKLIDPEVVIPGLDNTSVVNQIATGKARLKDLEKINNHENVQQLNIARPITPADE